MYPLRFYQGGCEVDPPIVVDFIVEDGTQACPTVQCSSSDYQEFGFVAPVNYTLNCINNNSSNAKLSGGAIAGIVIAVIVVSIGLLIGLLLFLGVISTKSLGIGMADQKASVNDGSSDQAEGPTGDQIGSEPSRASFGLKDVNDAL